ncbi:hypothetical protein A8M60_03095 [Nocardia farcinica]|nr:hypothetical protein A8M60_03095 [Nocardia farcinica]
MRPPPYNAPPVRVVRVRATVSMCDDESIGVGSYGSVRYRVTRVTGGADVGEWPAHVGGQMSTIKR